MHDLYSWRGVVWRTTGYTSCIPCSSLPLLVIEFMHVSIIVQFTLYISILLISYTVLNYYTEGVFMSPGGTGCIYSTLFDAHIWLIFSRQYHINCLSIQKHVQFHICIYFWYLAVCITLIAKSTCIYFRYLAVCITLIAKPTCIYFRFSAVNITLIDIFLSTLLHLAGY